MWHYRIFGGYKLISWKIHTEFYFQHFGWLVCETISKLSCHFYKYAVIKFCKAFTDGIGLPYTVIRCLFQTQLRIPQLPQTDIIPWGQTTYVKGLDAKLQKASHLSPLWTKFLLWKASSLRFLKTHRELVELQLLALRLMLLCASLDTSKGKTGSWLHGRNSHSLICQDKLRASYSTAEISSQCLSLCKLIWGKMAPYKKVCPWWSFHVLLTNLISKHS